MEQSTFLWEEHPAKTSALQGKDLDLAVNEAFSLSILSDWLMKAVQNGLFGKMSPVYSPARKDKILLNSYRYSLDGKLMCPKKDGESLGLSNNRPDASDWRGGCLTCNMPEWTAFPRAIPQRRNRVFVVGYLGDWRRAAEVLFEPEGLLGNTPPCREAGKELPEVLRIALEHGAVTYTGKIQEITSPRE